MPEMPHYFAYFYVVYVQLNARIVANASIAKTKSSVVLHQYKNMKLLFGILPELSC